MAVNFPKEEERILAQWNEINAFHRQLELSTSRKPYTFYDGPPFATGTPHYGHLLASSIKDIIPRYWSMKGHHVERRFGWDTHGVPIEQIIDNQLQQELGVRGRAAVEKIGIAEYNRRCRQVVLTYAGEWRKVIGRLGRWIDFDNDYKTMDCKFMESCWWVFKQLWEKDLVYHGAKVLPYSTALNTPLSKSEAQEDYRDVQDPAVVVSFPLLEDPDTSFLAWTTTPWTLPSNVGLCTHPDLEYLKIKDEESGKQYFLVEAGLKVLYKDPKKAKYKVLEKVKGKDLLGKKYLPPFDYFYEDFKDVGFKMLNDTYVSANDGVGIVHQSPAFGEDDYNIAWKAGVINEKRSPPNPLDAGGNFIMPVKDFLGQHVKAADKDIMKYLEKSGRLVKKSQITHRYPHCPRSKTPLIQRAVASWFIKVESMVPNLLKNLEKTQWVPASVKDARFHNWLESARDWNVSRNRYWGTPIPLWVSDDLKEIVCVGSVEELKELTGFQGDITDLHRDKVDSLTIPSKQGKGDLHRIEEVFDCWFESGSMPYASNHFPFENKDNFFDKYPGDFIAEGLDQTRGWFYTMSVLGTALFDTFPYKNCVVNGIVLAEDGKKMSKSLKNYPDPSLIMDKYGSDPLRLYMINSPVVRAEPLRFKEDGVKQIVSSVMLPLWNSYNFFAQQVALLKKTENQDFMWDPAAEAQNTNVMDRWILASTQSLLSFVNTEMSSYRLYTVVPRLLELIDNTTNWYIRFNRRRLKGEFGTSDTTHSLNTLFEVLYTLVRGLAPFTPFIADNIYQRLSPYVPLSHQESDTRSVHFLSYPTVRTELYSPETERRVSRMQSVIELGRLARDRRAISLKTPLKTLVVIHPSQEYLDDVRSLETYILDELNVRDLVLSSNDAEYNVQYSVLADVKNLGIKFKKDAARIRKALPSLSSDAIKTFLKEGRIEVEGAELKEEDLRVQREVVKTKETEKLEAATEGETMVLLDCEVYEELKREGLARELVNRVQRLRKKVGLVPTDDVRVVMGVEKGEKGEVEGVVREYEGMFAKAGKEVKFDGGEANGVEKEGQVVAEEEAEVRDMVVRLKLVKL
ncbi:isoleucine--tRNA ligase-like protein 2 [Elsinoe australis]|uniref:Isoleucine--tRNA ligase, cytoplasmic n=1 Tax=Elsinoe australis TaxID=40998 RepID=A0A4U7AZ14_9PEZI|nr:isoleucine--tRNA ligase-like protein 2 [Elsinoe australis]